MVHQLRQKDVLRFAEELRRTERSPATIEKYRRDLAAFRRWLPGDKGVDKERVIAYKSQLRERYAPARVNAALAALRAFFRFMGWGDCGVRLLKIQRRVFARPERELTREDYRRLLAEAEGRGDRRLALLLQTMAATGIRASEVRYITVEAARAGRAEISLKGKVRVILLPGKLCRKLLKYAQKENIASGQLMLTRSGRPMNRKEIWARMKKLCARAGVDPRKVFPHNLRRLFAREYFRLHRDVVKLADLLGHSSVDTTRIYLVDTGEEHLRELERLGLVS